MTTIANRANSSSNLPKSRGKHSVPLRTGRIVLSKSSATQILAIVGVKPADERLAKKALRQAAGVSAKGSNAEKGASARTVSKAASRKR